MGPRVRDGPELTTSLTVEKLVPGGAGFCRLPDGRSAFVDGAFPGDRVAVERFEEKRGYVRATKYELVERSPERVEPACPIADACGGCDWMRLGLGAQRRYKGRLVAEALERTGRLRLPVVPEVVARGEALGYRSRLRVHVDVRGKVGFFGRGSHSLVPAPACAVASAEVNRALGVLAALPPALAALLGRFEAAELAAGEGGEAHARLWHREGGSRDGLALGPLLEHLAREGVVVQLGPPARAQLGREEDGLRPWAAFTQVNPAVNAALVAAIVEGAGDAQAFLDLYAGSGNFSLPLAAGGRTGVIVELDRAAAESARRAAEERGLTLEVLALDTRRGLEKLVARRARFDLVVLDPPRAGAKEALPGIVALRPTRIAYVSCDPVTLARDLRELVAGGNRLDDVRCFDMFPQTHHVESLAWLSRTGA